MSWILTTTGREHELDGSAVFTAGNVPCLVEISHSLAQINRFTGHCARPYSVAEHSLLVADIARSYFNANPLVELAALLHDAHECITGDVASPIKVVLGSAWSDFENAQQENLLRAYGLIEAFEINHKWIKHCDLIALATERRYLLPFDPTCHSAWPILQGINALSVDLANPTRSARPWTSWSSEFNARAVRLMGEVYGTHSNIYKEFAQ